jgi:hypothetical protein
VTHQAARVFVVSLSVIAPMLLFSMLSACKHPDEARGTTSAPTRVDAGDDLELPPSTSQVPLAGVRVSVTRAAILVGEDQKQVATLESLGSHKTEDLVIVPLKDELIRRFPEHIFKRPVAYLYADRRTTFDVLLRVIATVGAASIGNVRFAGAGDGRIDELFPTAGGDLDRPLFVGVSDGGAFVELDWKRCRGALPAPNVRLVDGAPDPEALQRQLGPTDRHSGLPYQLMLRASDSTTFGEIAAFVDAMSRHVYLGSLAFCTDPHEHEKRTP